MESDSRPRVLCVDDEPHVLEGLARVLHRAYAVSTAGGGPEALELMAGESPFAVVVADMRMPDMDGATFLARVRARYPDTVRLLLTGYADRDAAIAAINDGQVYRFLTKPCPQEVLHATLDAACAQYQLITAERVLLEQTLRGAIKALTDILALVNPVAFGRAMRAKDIVPEVAARLGLGDGGWQLEVAAMLSPLGTVTLPPDTAEKIYFGKPLLAVEQQMADRLPALAVQLLSNIPRLDEVRDIVGFQAKRFDGGGLPRDGRRGEAIPIGARILKAVLDFDVLQEQGVPTAVAMDTMRSRIGCYDSAVLAALAAALGAGPQAMEVREIPLRSLRPGAILADDVRSDRGHVLVARGQVVTEVLCERVLNFAGRVAVVEPLRVLVRGAVPNPRPT